MLEQREKDALIEGIKKNGKLTFPLDYDQMAYLKLIVDNLQRKRRLMLNKLFAAILSKRWSGFSAVYQLIKEIGVENISISEDTSNQTGKSAITIMLIPK